MAKEVIVPLVPVGYPRILWSREQAKRASGPLVYIFWDVNEKGKRTALYVGRSRHGIHRPLDPAHAQSKAGRERAHEIEFICCETYIQAEALERKLIRHLQPALNCQGRKLPILGRKEFIRRETEKMDSVLKAVDGTLHRPWGDL